MKLPFLLLSTQVSGHLCFLHRICPLCITLTSHVNLRYSFSTKWLRYLAPRGTATQLVAFSKPASMAGQSSSSAGSNPETAELPKCKISREKSSDPVYP